MGLVPAAIPPAAAAAVAIEQCTAARASVLVALVLSLAPFEVTPGLPRAEGSIALVEAEPSAAAAAATGLLAPMVVAGPGAALLLSLQPYMP